MKKIQKGFALRIQNRRKRAGFTLVEISVVIGVIAILAGMVVWGVTAWRNAANKSTCIQQLHSIQTSMRSYANLNNLNVGDTLASTSIMGAGKLLEAAPSCPGGGTYTHASAIPAVGTAYTTCSLSGSGHAPTAAQVAQW